MATTIAVRNSRHRHRAGILDVPSAQRVGPPSAGGDSGSRLKAVLQAASANIWIAERHREILQDAGLATFDGVMNTQAGRCLRVLPDRENWYLRSTDPGMYLKKHRTRTWATRIAAAFGTARPPSAGRVEAENALALQSLGIDVMPPMAYGEKLHADGRMESFFLSEELAGYCELQDFIRRRFPSRNTPSLPSPHPRSPLPAPCSPLPADPALRRLIVQVAGIARRFHAAGFNHRDFYGCHFLVKEMSPGRFDVRLIDLQRVQQRRWFRRRWIVKDLAQLASMSPDDCIGPREKILFVRSYLGVQKLRTQDKRLVREVLGKLAMIRRRARHKS